MVFFISLILYIKIEIYFFDELLLKMSRQLLAEKMFLFIVSDNLDTKYKNKEYYGLVTSYVDIMKAQFVVYSPNILTKITPDIGTVIHVAPREEID